MAYNRRPGNRSPQMILHEIVIPALSRSLNKGNAGDQMKRLDYTTEPITKCTYVTITTDAGDTVRLVINPEDL